jgi:hypothetical protein
LYSKFEEEEWVELEVEQPPRGLELDMDTDFGLHKRPHNEADVSEGWRETEGCGGDAAAWV